MTAQWHKVLVYPSYLNKNVCSTVCCLGREAVQCNVFSIFALSQLFSCIVSVTSLLTGVLLSVFLYAVVQSWQFLYVHSQSAGRDGEGSVGVGGGGDWEGSGTVEWGR